MIEFKNIRVFVYSATLFRIEYQPQRQFEDHPTLLMGTRKPTEIEAIVKKRGNCLRVQTPKCELIYQQQGEDFAQDRLDIQFQHGDELRRWERSCQHTQSIPQVYRSLDEWPQGVNRHSTPIIINNDGWHVISDNAGVYWDCERQWPVVERRPYYQNLYLFTYGHDISQAFADFVHLFGRPPLLPRQAFGAWYSRWYDYQDQELLQLLDEYEQHQLGLDVLVVDVDWHRHHWNGYDWRSSSFPSPQKFIAAVKKKGLKLMLNDHPGYDLYDPLPEDDSQLAALRKQIPEPPYKGMWACDWSRASIVEKWAQLCLGKLLQQGIDWWWIDGWGDQPFPGIDGQLWLNWQYYRITRSLSPQKRALILSRWGGIGSHRYPVQFSGDTHSTFAQLEFQIAYTAYSGGVGAYYWSHDLGGFHEAEIDEELYIRWIQFGTFSPIFRTHSNHGIREPFRFSARALAIYRKYIRLRYQLLPYFEQLHFRNHLTGWPLLAPLRFTHPDADTGEQYPGQYLLGDYLLLAPINLTISRKEPACHQERVAASGAVVRRDHRALDRRGTSGQQTCDPGANSVLHQAGSDHCHHALSLSRTWW